MNRTNEEIEQILSTFHKPERALYPELDEYSDDECYQALKEDEQHGP